MARARAYVLGNIPADQKFRGQAELILNALKAGTEPMTTKAIADVIVSKLTTRQDPERVVAFYMSVWKKKGWVKVSEVDVTDAEAKSSNDADNAPHSVNDEVGGVDADTHNAVNMEVAVETANEFPSLEGKKLGEGVLLVMQHVGKPADAAGITDFLNAHGYDFKVNQVTSSLGNLLRQGRISRDGDLYTIA